MATVYRVTAAWAGFQGAPGYSKFSFTDLTTDVNRNAAGAAVRQLFFALAGYLPAGTSVTVSPIIQEFDVTTGVLQNESTMTTPPTVVNGTAAAGPFAGGSGFAMTWHTLGFFNGRKVRGRTFMVPTVGVYDNDGTLLSSVLTASNAAGLALINAASANFAIYARQFTKPVPPAKPQQINGFLTEVTSVTTKDMAAQLRSRKA